MKILKTYIYLFFISVLCHANTVNAQCISYDDVSSCILSNSKDAGDCLSELSEPFINGISWIKAACFNWRYGIKSKEVNVEMAEEIEDPVSRVNFTGNYITGLAEKTKKGAQCKFKLIVNDSVPEVRIIVRIDFATGFNATELQKEMMKQNIENSWSRKIKIVSSEREYPVVVEILIEDYFDLKTANRLRADASEFDIAEHIDLFEEHYLIFSKPTGRSTVENWALDSPGAPAHEFGHMIGAKDEYGIVDGIEYLCDGVHKYRKGVNMCTWHDRIMHTETGEPQLENFNLVVSEVESLIGEYGLYVEYMDGR